MPPSRDNQRWQLLVHSPRKFLSMDICSFNVNPNECFIYPVLPKCDDLKSRSLIPLSKTLPAHLSPCPGWLSKSQFNTTPIPGCYSEHFLRYTHPVLLSLCLWALENLVLSPFKNKTSFFFFLSFFKWRLIDIPRVLISEMSSWITLHKLNKPVASAPALPGVHLHTTVSRHCPLTFAQVVTSPSGPSSVQ